MVYKNSNLPALEKLIERIKTMSFSVQTQYKFLKIRKTIKDEADAVLIGRWAANDRKRNTMVQFG